MSSFVFKDLKKSILELKSFARKGAVSQQNTNNKLRLSIIMILFITYYTYFLRS